MDIYQNGIPLPINVKIAKFKKALKKNRIVTLNSAMHDDHVAAYTAWLEVGGNIFVKSPLLPAEQATFLDLQVKKHTQDNTIIFHTSGTTGVPKLITHTQKQFNQTIKMTRNAMGWEKNTKFLNFIPAFTSGFWHIVIPSLIYNDSSLILGSKETICNDFQADANLTILVPALIDQLRIKRQSIDLSKFSKICSGASQVLNRHAKWCFDNNAKVFNHMYGMTEICSPILHRETSSLDEYVEYLNLSPIADNEFKLVDKELWVKGPSLCEGSGEWFQTNDLWEEDNEKIKFVGRKNDVVKINGYQCSLLLIENTAEEKTTLGDTIAIKRNSLGSDWVELFYTNKHAIINKKELKSIFEPIVPKCNIPKRYTYIDQIPRNAYGKKTRHLLPTYQ